MSDPSPQAPPAAPRFRYFTVLPHSVKMTARQLLPALPEGAWTGSHADGDREITLPCAEILQGPVPRIRLSRLSDLLPGCVRVSPEFPEIIALPVAPVALAYHPETRQERIEPSGETAASSSVATEPEAPPIPPSKRIPSWKRILKPILGPSPEELHERLLKLRHGDGGTVPENETAPASETGEIPEEPASVPPPPEWFAPAPPLPRGVLAGQWGLQRLFMTEEDLTLQRVVDLSGELSGLAGCVLSHGEETFTSRDMAEGLDISALREAACNMLQRMRDGAVSSGLIVQPSLTIYTDRGPISFLESSGAWLIVLHKERGFLPGVREKLEHMLTLIAAPAGEQIH